jgi:LysM repeat protein
MSDPPVCQPYTVSPNESLNAIAMKFHIPTHRISARNPGLRRVIPPGTILQIESPDFALTEHYPFFVLLFEGMGDTPAGPGEVTIHGQRLVFDGKSDTPSPPIEVDLMGVIKADLCIHPNAMRDFHATFDGPAVPAMLVIVFLTDVFNPNSRKCLSFSAVRSELAALQFLVEKVSHSEQRRLAFVPEFSPTDAKRLAGLDSGTFKICGEGSAILTDSMVNYLRLAMAPRYRGLPWKRLYNMKEDGVSFLTFYEKGAEKVPQLLVLQTEKMAVVGCFVPDGFHMDKKVYGTGEVFVWSMNPEVAVYRWAQTNESFVAAGNKDIMIGGPTPALFIAEQFKRGFTEQCVTFGSPRLLAQSSFKIARVELWGLSYAYH